MYLPFYVMKKKTEYVGNNPVMDYNLFPKKKNIHIDIK